MSRRDRDLIFFLEVVPGHVPQAHTLEDVRLHQLEADAGLFDRSAIAPLILGVVGGALLTALGAAVALNWRGWAERYSNAVDAFVPPRRDDWRAASPRFLLLNRLIVGGLGLFGVALLSEASHTPCGDTARIKFVN